MTLPSTLTPSVTPQVAIATHADALPPPRAAIHRVFQANIAALDKIADNIAKAGEPDGDVVAFFMRAFTPAGAVVTRTAPAEAAWISAAGCNLTNLEQIAAMNADAFRAAMRAALPPLDNHTPLMDRLDDHDLLAIHATAIKVRAATA